MKNKDTPEDQTHYTPLGMCLGISIGTAVGVAIDNLSLCMCIGLSIGLLVGAIIDAGNRKKLQDEESNE